jgi:ATP-binding cassette subfamily B protein
MMVATTWAQVTVPELMGQAVDCYLTPATTSTAASENALMAEFLDFGGSASESNCWYDTPQADWTTADYIQGLGTLVLKLMGLFLLGAVTTGLMFYFMVWSGQHVLRSLRVQVFKQINRLSVSYHVEHETGDTMSRVTNDADTIQQGMTFALIQVTSGVMLLVWVSYNMLTSSVPYALVAMAMIPAMAIATSWFSAQARKAYRRTRVEMGSVNAELQESIAGVREAQAFSREDENIASFNETNAAYRDANIRAVAYTSALAPMLEALGYVALMLVTVVGGWAIINGSDFYGTTISLGLMITFVAYVQRFNQPVQQIAVLWTNIQSGIAGGERIFGLMDIEQDIKDAPDAIELPEIQGKIELDDVWSEYVAGEPVLKGVSLFAEPGQIVAIVGPTGAGKTTIANLIPRFYDVTRGAVKIDDVDVRKATKSSLRRQIAVVLQDSFLFGRTGLSLGQRQLMAIARAALANPRILILDEATSSVDTRTERLIQGALEVLLAERTSIVIAHRLSTIRNADQVLVINEGEIIERGTHDSLMAAKGFYYDLYMSQFRRQVPGGDGKQPGLSPSPGSAGD